MSKRPADRAQRSLLRDLGARDRDGTLTTDGEAARRAVEDHTTRMSLAPTVALGPDTARLVELATTLSTALRDAGAFPDGVAHAIAPPPGAADHRR